MNSSMFTELLLQQYEKINPLFQKENMENNLFVDFYNIIGDEELQQNVDEFKKYIDSNSDYIKLIVTNNDNKIFKQPIILLIYYSFKRWCNRTINNWPYSSKTLNDVLHGFGISSDILYDI